MKKHVYRFCAGIACVIMFFCFTSTFAFAKESAVAEIVFVLDTSGSMNTNDPSRLAADGINQMVHSMLSNVDVGFVAFGDEVTDVVPLTGHAGREKLTQQVSTATYTGYTDAGGALETAVGLFSKSSPTEKYIVILSDGEIAMKTKDATDRSVAQYASAVAAAKDKSISIFTIGLEDELADINNSIFDAAKQSGGKTYYAPTANDLQNTINTILWTDLGFRKSAVASVMATGGEDHISVNLPGAGADTVRILLFSSASVRNIGINCTAEEMQIYSGKKFGIVELKKPSSQNIEVRFTGGGGERVSAELVTEYRAVAAAAVTYEDDVNYERVLRTATVTLTLNNAENSNENLLDDPYFEGEDILLEVDGKTQESQEVKIRNGVACFTRPVSETETLRITASLPHLALNLFPLEPVTLELESLPPPPDYRPLWITLGVLAVAVAGIAVFLLSRRVKIQKRLQQPEVPKSIYDFAGKLNLYVTHTSNGTDVAPQTFRLYRQFSKKEISLASILEQCGIKLEFRGAATIMFQPGANHSLIITNKSDCTLLKGHELIMRDHSYPIYFEEKMTIIFEDELSELTMIYKNVKPGDR